jgi:hypothetical protein
MLHKVGKNTGQVYCFQWTVFWLGLVFFVRNVNKSHFWKKILFFGVAPRISSTYPGFHQMQYYKFLTLYFLLKQFFWGLYENKGDCHLINTCSVISLILMSQTYKQTKQTSAYKYIWQLWHIFYSNLLWVGWYTAQIPVLARYSATVQTGPSPATLLHDQYRAISRGKATRAQR